ncbi:MAG: hypothetical protein M3405_10255 [Acidobacteriota bacterium]|jgi:hypothetical protein|nr:hypothetical protein [Acidobacteriota bacterium]
MKQHEAVIKTMERLGGIATLGQLYQETFKIEDCVWNTKTPFASIRRIVQTRSNEIYKIKPGLYGLLSHLKSNEAKGILAENDSNKDSLEIQESNHYYYQGLLLTVGRIKKFQTFAPNQDKNRKFLNKTLGEMRTLDKIPDFSYPNLVQRSSTIDVIWFNQRKMPDSFFEVESTTDIRNSLGKYTNLQDFFVRMIIVADSVRQKQFDSIITETAYETIKKRVEFLDYEALVKQYEYNVRTESFRMIL